MSASEPVGVRPGSCSSSRPAGRTKPTAARGDQCETTSKNATAGRSSAVRTPSKRTARQCSELEHTRGSGGVSSTTAGRNSTGGCSQRSNRRPEGAPQLDTLGTSRQPSAGSTDSALQWATGQPRIEWLRRVEALTADFRERKAWEQEAKARVKEHAARKAGMNRKDVRQVGKWHRDRAWGHRYRFENALSCGDGPKVRHLTCEDCGSTNVHALTCSATLVCVRCRGRLQAERREQLKTGVAAIEWRAKRRGLLRRNRKGGRWSHKQVVLTVPHLAEHSIGGRVDLFHKAWTPFLKSFNAWMLELAPRGAFCTRDEPCESCEHCLVTWYGSCEWTVGNDRKGHPHAQLWFFGPFIDKDIVRDLWQAALEKAGLGEPREVNGRTVYRWEGPVLDVDVQECKEGKVNTYELAKYVVKDIVKDGEFIDPAIFAELYEALDMHRLRRGSKGFIKLCETSHPCPDCGAVHWSQRIVKKPIRWDDDNALLEKNFARPPPAVAHKSEARS